MPRRCSTAGVGKETRLKLKSRKDLWSGLLFVVAGVAFATGATNYRFGESARPGPGYFPFGLGILLAGLGLIVLLRAFTVDAPDGGRVGKIAWRPLLVVVGAILVFALTLTHLGMAIALPLLVICISYAGDEFHWKGVLNNSAVLTIGSWLIFIEGLGLIIPMWPAFMD
jgi:hypothetical protein